MWHKFSRYLMYRRQQLGNRSTYSGCQIERDRYSSRRQIFEGFYVRPAQIGDVDIIANTGSIRRRQVVAENLQWRQSPQRSPERQGSQVRFRIVAFSDAAVRIRTSRVEVTQRNITQTI